MPFPLLYGLLTISPVSADLWIASISFMTRITSGRRIRFSSLPSMTAITL